MHKSNVSTECPTRVVWWDNLIDHPDIKKWGYTADLYRTSKREQFEHFLRYLLPYHELQIEHVESMHAPHELLQSQAKDPENLIIVGGGPSNTVDKEEFLDLQKDVLHGSYIQETSARILQICLGFQNGAYAVQKLNSYYDDEKKIQMANGMITEEVARHHGYEVTDLHEEGKVIGWVREEGKEIIVLSEYPNGMGTQFHPEKPLPTGDISYQVACMIRHYLQIGDNGIPQPKDPPIYTAVGYR